MRQAEQDFEKYSKQELNEPGFILDPYLKKRRPVLLCPSNCFPVFKTQNMSIGVIFLLTLPVLYNFYRSSVFHSESLFSKSTWVQSPNEKLQGCQYPFSEFLNSFDEMKYNECLYKVNLLNKIDSSTVEDAIQSYKDRYSKSPPQLFNKWFDYAKARQCRIDNYDELMHQLSPFFNASDISSLIQELIQLFPGSGQITKFNIKNKDTIISDMKWDRAAAYKSIFKAFQEFLPDFEFAINTHAQPITMNKQTALYPNQVNRFKNAPGSLGYTHLTLVNDNKQSIESYQDILTKVCRKSQYFESMRHGYGLFMSPSSEQQSFKAYPILSWSNYPDCSSDILIPSPYHYDYGGAGKVAYSNKPFHLKRPQLVWRGATSGSPFFTTTTNPYFPSHVCFSNCNQSTQYQIQSSHNNASSKIWFWSHRQRLLGYAKEFPNLLNIRNVGSVEMASDYVKDSNELYGKHARIQFNNFFEYQFVLDVDGNGYSGRFLKLLRGNSLVFAAHYATDWYSDISIPFYHFIPVNIGFEDIAVNDDIVDLLRNKREKWDKFKYSYKDSVNSPLGYNDLAVKVAYFKENLEIAEKIANQGQRFAQKRLRKKDMDCYLFRVLTELYDMINK